MKLCNHPGCKEIISNDHSRCSKHQIVQQPKRYLEHQFLLIDGRRQYLYTSNKWRKLSKRHKKEFPCCKRCLDRDVVTPVDISDHIVPVEVAPEKAFDWQNIQSLCLSCHNVKTSDDNRKYGLKPSKRFNSPFKKKS